MCRSVCLFQGIAMPTWNYRSLHSVILCLTGTCLQMCKEKRYCNRIVLFATAHWRSQSSNYIWQLSWREWILCIATLTNEHINWYHFIQSFYQDLTRGEQLSREGVHLRIRQAHAFKCASGVTLIMLATKSSYFLNCCRVERSDRHMHSNVVLVVSRVHSPSTTVAVLRATEATTTTSEQ